ncbi:MAG: Ku protein [Armatimonadota bacterium]
MPQGIWKGHISFGLVNIPIMLHPAETRDELDLDLLDRRDFSPIGYLKVNKRTGKEVPKDEIVRGFEYKEGKYVVLEDGDLKRASPDRTQKVEILAFVDPNEIDPRFYDRPHSVLLLNLLRYADELRDPKKLKLPGSNLKGLGISEKEVKTAERLIEEMVEPWKPALYRDEYKDELLAFIRRKAEKGDLEAVEEAKAPRPEKGKIIDMMALLKRSLEQAEGGRRKTRRKTA